MSTRWRARYRIRTRSMRQAGVGAGENAFSVRPCGLPLQPPHGRKQRCTVLHSFRGREQAVCIWEGGTTHDGQMRAVKAGAGPNSMRATAGTRAAFCQSFVRRQLPFDFNPVFSMANFDQTCFAPRTMSRRHLLTTLKLANIGRLNPRTALGYHHTSKPRGLCQ